MFITEKLAAALNRQVGHEFANALQYVALANWFEAEDLCLAAKFYYTQADEERGHAQKITRFLIDSDAEVAIPDLGSVVNRFAGAVEAAQLAYDSEVKTTEQILVLVALSQSEGCPTAFLFLQWFVEEQVEEVATARRNLHVLSKAGNNFFLTETVLFPENH